MDQLAAHSELEHPIAKIADFRFQALVRNWIVPRSKRSAVCENFSVFWPRSNFIFPRRLVSQGSAAFSRIGCPTLRRNGNPDFPGRPQHLRLTSALVGWRLTRARLHKAWQPALQRPRLSRFGPVKTSATVITSRRDVAPVTTSPARRK